MAKGDNAQGKDGKKAKAAPWTCAPGEWSHA